MATGQGNPWRSLEKYDPDEELPHISAQAYEAWLGTVQAQRRGYAWKHLGF